MSDFTPPNGTPKDINNRLGVVKGLDPGDPNDTAFKLVTILCFFVVSKKLSFFPFFCERHHLPPSPMFSLNPLSRTPPLPSPPLGGRVSSTSNRSHSINWRYY